MRQPRPQIFVHSSQTLTELTDSSVNLMFESPPYEKMVKCCGEPQCLSSHAAEDFVREFARFLPERLRVLKDDGNYLVNFSPQVISGFSSPAEYLLPQAVVAAGFRLVQTHIWGKPNATPFAPDRRLKNSVEYCWHFAKSDGYFFDKDAARVAHEWVGRDQRKERYHALGKDPGTLFMMSKSQDQSSLGHPAKMKDGVASRFIKLLCPQDGLVVDGFAGTGQTGVEAVELGRRFIGFELHQERAEVARQRLGIREDGEDLIMKEWLTSKEVAAYCGLALATIYSKTSRGEVPVHRGAGVPRYFKPEIDAWMRGDRMSPANTIAQEPTKELT
jgi:DNA modification methylase/predicted DNA-binding transcriptional regulator AlpA